MQQENNEIYDRLIGKNLSPEQRQEVEDTLTGYLSLLIEIDHENGVV